MWPCEAAGPGMARLRTSTKNQNPNTRLRHLRRGTFWVLFGASKSSSSVRTRPDLDPARR